MIMKHGSNRNIPVQVVDQRYRRAGAQRWVRAPPLVVGNTSPSLLDAECEVDAPSSSTVSFL